MNVEFFAVAGDDAGGFLATMLKGVETEIGEVRRFGMAEDAEDTTLVVEMVVEDSGYGLQDTSFRFQSSRFDQAYTKHALETARGAAQTNLSQSGGTSENVSTKIQTNSPKKRSAAKYLPQRRRLKIRYAAQKKRTPIDINSTVETKLGLSH